MSTYAERRRHPKWQAARLRCFERAGFKCEDCGDDQHELQLHHVYYLTGRECWDHPPILFKCVCDPCHVKRQAIEQTIYVNVACIIRDMLPDQMQRQPIWTLFDEGDRPRPSTQEGGN